MFNVLITRKRKEDAGYPIVVKTESLDGYLHSGDHFIIKLGVTEEKANEIFTQISGGLIDLANGLYGHSLTMEQIVNRLFFGGK